MEHAWKLIWTNFLKVFLPIGAVVGLSWALYSAASHFAKLDARLETVENQVKLLAVAPTISRQGGNAWTYEGSTEQSGKPQKGATDDVYGSANSVPNPLIATCIDLIKRTATAKESRNYGAESSLDNLLRDYGCPDLLKRLPPK